MKDYSQSDRFTDRSRKVLQLANVEADRFNHEYLGTEHLLLGLVKEGSGVAANVLRNCKITSSSARIEIEKFVRTGPADATKKGSLPHTPRLKNVLEWSHMEADNLSHERVGTEHLLLGLLRDTKGIAAQVIFNHRVRLEDVAKDTLLLLGASSEGSPNTYLSDEARSALDKLRLALGKHDLSALVTELLEYYQKKEGLPENWQPTVVLIEQYWSLLAQRSCTDSEEAAAYVERHSYDEKFVELAAASRKIADELGKAAPIVRYLLVMLGSGPKAELAMDLLNRHKDDKEFLNLAVAAEKIFPFGQEAKK